MMSHSAGAGRCLDPSLPAMPLGAATDETGTFEVFFGDDQKRWRLALLQELGEAPVISLKKAAETASTTSRAP